MTARLLAATGSAVLILFAAPPWNVHALALVAFVPLGLAIGHGPSRRAAFLAFLAGTVAHLGVSPWWPAALQRVLDMPRGSSIVVAVLLAAYQALPLTLAAAGAQWLHHRFRGASGAWRFLSWRIFSAPLLLAMGEALLPFPFKAYMAILVWRTRSLVQVAEWGGPPSVSALLLAINLTGVVFLVAARDGQVPKAQAWLALGMILAMLGWGQVRIAQVAGLRERAPSIRAGLLQPNFPAMTLEERQKNGHHLVRTLQDASAELSRRGAELIVLPESAWPYVRTRSLEQEWPPHHPWHLPRPQGGQLLFGVLSGFDEVGLRTTETARIWNRAVLIGADGRVAGRHDKQRLVPLAESEPAAAVRLAGLAGGALPERPVIRPGGRPGLLRDGALRLAVMICAEDLDRRQARRLAAQGANLLVGLANDAWFGASAAAEQHFALATFRAVEARRDFLRVGLTGHSGLIDATGRVQAIGPLVVPTGRERPTLWVYEVRLL